MTEKVRTIRVERIAWANNSTWGTGSYLMKQRKSDFFVFASGMQASCHPYIYGWRALLGTENCVFRLGSQSEEISTDPDQLPSEWREVELPDHVEVQEFLDLIDNLLSGDIEIPDSDELRVVQTRR